MKGKILAYSSVVSAGVIKSANGQKYGFSLHDWNETSALPVKSQPVEFTEIMGNAAKVSADKS